MHSPMFSLEVFPPKRTSPVGTIYDTLDGLQGLDPDFISVTYGTGKSSDRTLTARIAHTVSEYGIPSVAHLTAQYLNKDDVDQALDMFEQAKVSGVLALRGDRIDGAEPAGVFEHASDLAVYIRQQRPDMKIYGACYPEKHPQSATLEEDIDNLKKKVDLTTVLRQRGLPEIPRQSEGCGNRRADRSGHHAGHEREIGAEHVEQMPVESS